MRLREIEGAYTKEKQLQNNKPKKVSMFGKKKYVWNKSGKKPKGFKRKPPKIKKNDIVDNEYSKWLATQPCVITGRVAPRGAGAYDMHCHHIFGRSPRDDYMQVPLLGIAHSWGDKAYHQNTKEDFIKKWGLLVDDIVEYFVDMAKHYNELYLENGGKILKND